MALRCLRGQRKDITKRGDQFQFPFQRAGEIILLLNAKIRQGS